MKVLLNLPSSRLGEELREAFEKIKRTLVASEQYPGFFMIKLDEPVVNIITDKQKRFDFVLLHGDPPIAVLRQSARQIASNIVGKLNDSYYTIYESMTDTCRELTRKIATGEIQPMEICLETPHKCRKRRQRKHPKEHHLPDRERLSKLFA